MAISHFQLVPIIRHSQPCRQCICVLSFDLQDSYTSHHHKQHGLFLRCLKDGRQHRLSQASTHHLIRPASTAPTSTSTSFVLVQPLHTSTSERALPSMAENARNTYAKMVERHQFTIPPNHHRPNRPTSFPLPTRRRAYLHCYLYHPFHGHTTLWER